MQLTESDLGIIITCMEESYETIENVYNKEDADDRTLLVRFRTLIDKLTDMKIESIRAEHNKVWRDAFGMQPLTKKTETNMKHSEMMKSKMGTTPQKLVKEILEWLETSYSEPFPRPLKAGLWTKIYYLADNDRKELDGLLKDDGYHITAVSEDVVGQNNDREDGVPVIDFIKE